MATQIGKLEEFDISSCDVDTYFERLESFFVANDVGDEKKGPYIPEFDRAKDL